MIGFMIITIVFGIIFEISCIAGNEIYKAGKKDDDERKKDTARLLIFVAIMSLFFTVYFAVKTLGMK